MSQKANGWLHTNARTCSKSCLLNYDLAGHASSLVWLAVVRVLAGGGEL